jgi:hypothetical protein
MPTPIVRRHRRQFAATFNFYKGTDVADIHHQHTHTIDQHGASSPVRQVEA